MAYILPINPFMKFFIFTIFSIILATGLQAEDPYLNLDYYKSSCPSVLDIVKREMECAVLSDPRNAAIILRLHFHDCFVQVSANVAIDSPATSRQYGTYGWSAVTVEPLWRKWAGLGYETMPGPGPLGCYMSVPIDKSQVGFRYKWQP